MSSTRPPLVSGKSGNLTVSVTPSSETLSSPEPESPGSEFSTPPTSPHFEDSPDSPPFTPSGPAQRAPSAPPVDSAPTPPLVRAVSPLLHVPSTPRAEDSPESPPCTPPAPSQRAPPPLPVDSLPTPPLPVDSLPTPPLVRTVSPLLPRTRMNRRAEDSHESPPSGSPAPAQKAPPPPPADSIPRPPPAPTSPRPEYSHESPPSNPLEPAQRAPALLQKKNLSQPPPVQVSTPLVKVVSMPLQAPELSSHPPPPVQVPPSQFEKALPASDGSVLALFWDAVARVQKAHASLDEHISRWFGLDQSRYQWALNEYYESTGQDIDSGKAGNEKDHSCKVQKI